MNRPDSPAPRPPRRSITQNPAYLRARGVFGVLFIVLGAFIIVQIVHGVGLHVEAIPGAILGLAMIALGYVRIRGAFAAGKPPAP
jgi:hypothetical protein